MSRNKRKFGLEEKLQILREGENQGVDVTCRKYQIARSLYCNWKSKFDHLGPFGLAPISALKRLKRRTRGKGRAFKKKRNSFSEHEVSLLNRSKRDLS